MVAKKFRVHNHDWKNPDCLEYVGDNEQNVPVWINKLVSNADLVIGTGSIMRLKSAIYRRGENTYPRVSASLPATKCTGPESMSLRMRPRKIENPVRASIDSLARKAGLDFIVNVILDAENKIIGAVAGDMVAGPSCRLRNRPESFGVKIPREFDIVIADSFLRYRILQANKLWIRRVKL